MSQKQAKRKRNKTQSGMEKVRPQEATTVPPDLPPLSQRSSVEFTHTTVQLPFVPPAILAEYDRVVPGAAKTIIDMAAGEQLHRHGLDNHNAQAGAAQSRRGHWVATAICVGAITAGATVIVLQPSVAGAIAGTVIAVFVPVAIMGRGLFKGWWEGKRAGLHIDTREEGLDADPRQVPLEFDAEEPEQVPDSRQTSDS